MIRPAFIWRFFRERGTGWVLPAPLLATTVVAAVLVIGPASDPAHDFDAPGLDPEAVEVGLRARVGDELAAWEIEVRETRKAGSYLIVVREVGERRRSKRRVELAGETDEDRSRELASMLALMLDELGREADPGANAGSAPGGDPPASGPLTGFVLFEGSAALGPPRDLDPEIGVGLGGGLRLLGDHLQPRARFRWAHSWAGDLRVDGISGGLGLAAGAPVGPVWLGGLVMPAFKWTRGADIKSGVVWSGGGELSVVAEYRYDRLIVGLRTGVETLFPPVKVSGPDGIIRWRSWRWLLVLEIGFSI